jgi:hypothetical protein
MALLLYQDGLLQTLAYLMGERTVNSTTSASRADFLQKTLVEVYKAYPWKFARATATLSISSGILTLPTDYNYAHPIDVMWTDSGNNQWTLNEIDPADKDKVVDGDLSYWLSAQSDGSFLLKTKDVSPTSVAVSYQKLAPTLSTDESVGTPYPSGMTLALGARRFVKLGQNPDADISQDQDLFEKYLSQDIAAEQVPHARKRRNTRQYLTGNATGDF